MLARNCCVSGLFVAEKRKSGKESHRPGVRLFCLLAVSAIFVLSVIVAPGSAAQERAASAQEVQQLRKDVNDLRETVKRLEALLEARSSVPAQPSATNPAVQPSPAPEN